MPETEVVVLFVAVGAAILITLIGDIFFTAFRAEGRGGPLNRRLNRGVWHILRWLGKTVSEGRRPGVLALGGSLQAVITIIVWMLLLILGFALIYYPFLPHFEYSPTVPGPWWVDALYYSGYSASTLGLGDMVASDSTLRLLTIIEALSGFGIFTVAVTYVLAVFRELGKVQSLASEIDAYFGAGIDRIVEHATGEAAIQVASWEERVAASLLRVLEAHWQYPVLHYFRPRDDYRSLPLQLGKLISYLESTHPGSDGGEAEPSRRDPDEGAPAGRRGGDGDGSGAGTTTSVASWPSRDLLERALDSYLQRLEHHYVPGAIDDESGEEEGIDRWRHRQRLLYHLGYEREEHPRKSDGKS